MKRSFKLLLCIVAIIALFVGCELPMAPEDTHGHAFVDANSDNICDECNTDGAATHGHIFVDANDDDICDTCADAAHVHTYATEWSYDATNHWYAATCAHDTLKKGEEAHTLDAFGVCTVCENQIGAPDLSTVEKAIAFAIAMQDKVENGSIIKNDYFGTVIDYIFANDYFYTKSTQTENADSFTETWYSTDAAGDIFAVVRDEYGVRRMTAYSDNIVLDNLNGVEFISPLATETYYYGLEALIAGLYEFGADNINGDWETSIENGVFAFSYGYFYDGTFYVVNVDFTLSDECYIDNANVSIKSYGSVFDWDTYETIYEYIVIPGATDNDEPTYAVAEGAEGYVEMNYTFAQNVEEILENEYPAAEVLASSFKLVDANGNEITNSLAINKGVAAYLYLAEILPETAILSFTEIIATGAAIDDYDMFVRAETDDYGNWAIYVICYTVGEFDITLSINGIVKNISVVCEAVKPTDVEVSVYEEETVTDWWGDSFNVYVPSAAPSEIIVWAKDGKLILGGFADKGDNLNCTATVNGAPASYSEIEIQGEYGIELIDAIAIDTSVAGEYVIVFTSEADTTLTKTVKVIVKDVPDVEAMLDGKYVYTVDGVNIYAVEFDSGIMNVSYLTYDEEDEVWVLYDAKYAYEWVDGNLETTLVNGYEFDEQVTLGESTDYTIQIDGYTLVKETAELVLVGTWSFDVFDYEVSFVDPADVYTLTFNADGTGVFTSSGVKFYFTYTIGAYDEVNGNYPITITADDTASNVGTTTAFGTTATVALGQVFSWETYTQEWAVIVDNGEMDEWENPINYQYSKPAVESVDGYEWPTELEIGAPTNVYGAGVEQIQLLINAAAGKYTVYVCYWGETTPITALNEYSFVVDGINVVGALMFEVEGEERIVLTMNVPTDGYDYDIYVTFEAAEVEEETGSSSGFIVTTDANKSINQGSYTYSIDEDGKITIYDGSEVASFSDTYALTFVDGVLTVYSGTANAKPLTKYEGEDGVLAGSWKLVMNLGGEFVVFDFTIEASSDEDESESNVLSVGANDIAVSADDMDAGTMTYVFTPDVSGEYKFTSNDLAIAAIANGANSVIVISGYANLEAGVTYTITINLGFVFNAGTYVLNIQAPITPDQGGDVDAKVLVVGENTNTATMAEAMNMEGIAVTFTATVAGEYTIAYNANVSYMLNGTSPMMSTFTAEAGQVFNWTVHLNGGGEYIITITAPAAE